MLNVILVSNYSMKEELEQSLKSNNYKFHDLMIQDINHIERYPIDDEYKTIIIQSANAIKKIDSSNNHIYNAKYIYGIGPNCRTWVQRKFSLDCIVPDHDYSSSGLIEKIECDNYALGKTLLLKGIGGKTTIQDFLESEDLDYKICNVYERVLNEDNLHRVTAMIQNEAIVYDLWPLPMGHICRSGPCRSWSFVQFQDLEVGGLSPTGKSFRFVSCVCAVCMSSQIRGKS